MDKHRVPDKLPIQYRAMPMKMKPGEMPEGMDAEKRTVEVAFSSETPVERWWGTEILDHGPGCVRMERMQNGAAVMINHDATCHVGVVESARIEKGVGRAVIRFGNSPMAQEKFNDVKDGILRHVSVGYRINKIDTTTDGKGQNEVDRITDWEPMEISLVAVPADPNVGVGRAADGAQEFPVVIHRNIPAAQAAQEQRPMEQETKAASTATAAVEVKTDNRALAADILAVCRHFKMDESETDTILRGAVSLEQAKSMVSDVIVRKPRTSEVTTITDEVNRDKRQFNLKNMILASAGDRSVDAQYEREVSDALAKALPSSYKSKGGFYVPNVRTAAVGLDATTSNQGKESIAVLMQGLIDYLYNQTKVLSLGATRLSGLNGDLAFPVHYGIGSATWVTDNPTTDVSDSDASMHQVTMAPKILQASTSFSRKLLAQSTIDIEGFVRREIAMRHALAIDLAAIKSPDTSAGPKGVYDTTGVTAVGTAGLMDVSTAAATYASIVSFETAVAEANADNLGIPAWLTTPKVRGQLKQTARMANTIALPIWPDGGGPLGYRGEVSNQVPKTLGAASPPAAHGVILGIWQELLLGDWGVLETIVDPYRLKKQGMIEVTTFQMCDILLRYPVAFAKGFFVPA